MAARAIVGILLGILFAPVIFLILVSIGDTNAFSGWFWSITSDFGAFFTNWMNFGIHSTIAPLIGPGSLIDGFGAGSLLEGFLPSAAGALITWTLIGVWAGSIERSSGRGIGVGVGIWLAWLIIAMIGIFLIPEVAAYFLILYPILDILTLILDMLLSLIVVIIVAAIFGAMTKSEEF